MRLFNLHKGVRKFIAGLSTNESIGQYFETQKAAVQAIKHEAGYTEIVQYREREANEAMSMLTNENTPLEKVAYWRAKHNNAIDFLNRLEQLNS